MSRFVFIAAMLVTLCLSAPTTADDDRNAATWYGRAIERREALTPAEWALIDAYREDPSAAPSPALRDLIAKATPMFNDLRRGSFLEHADYGLDYGLGFDLPLPHLGALRAVSKVMEVDALVRLHDGDAAGAADRIATLYRVSSHFNDDGFIVSSLAGLGTFSLAEQAIQRGLDQAQFSPADSEKMLRSLDRLEDADPFGMSVAVVVEQEVAVDWLAAMFGSQEQRLQALEGDDFLTFDAQQAEMMAAMTDEEFAASLDQYDRTMDRVVAAFANPDRDAGRAELAEIERMVEAGEAGLLARMVMPALGATHELMLRAEAHLAHRKEILAGLVTGVIKPEDEANAALLYAEAIRIIRALDPERFQAICDYDSGGVKELAEADLETLADASGAIDLLREASRRRRCDFGLLRPGRRPRLCADYIAGMRDAFHLLHADAKHRAASHDVAESVDRLATGYRVIAHLSGDTELLGNLVAHRAFDVNHAMAKALIDGARLDEERMALLRGAIERIERKDPFGYIAALASQRDLIADPFRQRPRIDEETARHLDEILGEIGAWAGDRVLFYLAVHDTMVRAGRKDDDGDATAGPDPVSRLADVLDAEQLERVRAGVIHVAPILAIEDYAGFGRLEIPDYAGVGERMRRARSDLRRGVALLRPPTAPAASPPTSDD